MTKATTDITSFTGDYFWLSNFELDEFPFPPLGDGVIAKSGEHAYQAMKVRAAEQQEWVLKAKTAGEAKKRGRQVSQRSTWDVGFRVYAMRLVIEYKFDLDSVQGGKLLDTGHARLVEGNTWHDNYWGDCTCTGCWANPSGTNMLGELLMAQRTMLRNFKKGRLV